MSLILYVAGGVVVIGGVVYVLRKAMAPGAPVCPSPEGMEKLVADVMSGKITREVADATATQLAKDGCTVESAKLRAAIPALAPTPGDPPKDPGASPSPESTPDGGAGDTPEKKFAGTKPPTKPKLGGGGTAPPVSGELPPAPAFAVLAGWPATQALPPAYLALVYPTISQFNYAKMWEGPTSTGDGYLGGGADVLPGKSAVCPGGGACRWEDLAHASNTIRDTVLGAVGAPGAVSTSVRAAAVAELGKAAERVQALSKSGPGSGWTTAGVGRVGRIAPPPWMARKPVGPMVETRPKAPGSTIDLSTVAGVQIGLITLGYSVGPTGADGKHGPYTGAAVSKFRVDQGMPPSTTVDNALRAMLAAALRAKGYSVTGTSGPTYDMSYGTGAPPSSFVPAAKAMGRVALPSKIIDVNDLPRETRDAMAFAITREGDPRVLCALANAAASKGHYGVAARLAGAAAGIHHFRWIYAPLSRVRDVVENGIPARFRAAHGGVASFVLPPSFPLADNLAYLTLDELSPAKVRRFFYTDLLTEDGRAHAEHTIRTRLTGTEAGMILGGHLLAPFFMGLLGAFKVANFKPDSSQDLAFFLASLATFKAAYIELELKRLVDSGGSFSGFVTSPCNPAGTATVPDPTIIATVAPLGGTVAPGGTMGRVDVTSAPGAAPGSVRTLPPWMSARATARRAGA